MTQGLYITKNDFLTYNEISAKEIGETMFCPSFSIKISSIRIIALLPRLPFDDERLFIVFVDNSKNTFVIPDIVLKSDALKEIESIFNLETISNEWNQFEYSDHNSFSSKIIYPPFMKGKELFSKPFENTQTFIAALKNLFLTNNSTTGLFTEDVKKEILNL